MSGFGRLKQQWTVRLWTVIAYKKWMTGIKSF